MPTMKAPPTRTSFGTKTRVCSWIWVTDWMIDNAEIEQEEQTLTAYVAYEEARANDSTMKARHIKKFVARITATNAATRTYRHTEATSYTPAEAVPTGWRLLPAVHRYLDRFEELAANSAPAFAAASVELAATEGEEA